jgi:hypothetical protein
MSRIILALPLLVTLASSSAAQVPVALTGGAIRAAPATVTPPSTGRVSVRILTLTWQENWIPERLTTSTERASPVPRRFVLNWQPLPASAGDAPLASRSECRTMRLVLVPCE